MTWSEFTEAFRKGGVRVSIENGPYFKPFCEALEEEGFYAKPDGSIYLRTVRSRDEYPFLGIAAGSKDRKEVACWSSAEKSVTVGEIDSFDHFYAALIDEASQLLEDAGGDVV